MRIIAPSAESWDVIPSWYLANMEILLQKRLLWTLFAAKPLTRLKRQEQLEGAEI